MTRSRPRQATGEPTVPRDLSADEVGGPLPRPGRVIPGLDMAWWPIEVPDLVGLPRGIAVIQEDGYIDVVGQFARIGIEPRPTHCDRGRYVAKIDALDRPNDWRLSCLNLERLDGWEVGRFYMRLERALPEVIEWLADRESRVTPDTIARFAPPEPTERERTPHAPY